MNKLPERVRRKDIARLADVSVGTVDRVLHGRSGVSEASRKRVEEILKQLDYQPNMYASSLASNKKYVFCCLLPMHDQGEYWSAVEKGITNALKAFSDFHISIKTTYYDPYDYQSFISSANKITDINPDGVMVAPTIQAYTESFIRQLNDKQVPFIYIDSNIKELPGLSFYGQNSRQSGYFAARMLMLTTQHNNEVVIFRKIQQGVVGSNQQENREKGFRRYMKEHHPDCIIHECNLQADSNSNDFTVLEQFFKLHPKVSSGITFNSKAHTIGEFLETDKTISFNLIGYDLLEQNVKCLKNRSIAFLIAQQPELQGYSGIKTLCDYLIFKKEVKQINYMPIDLLSIENIDYYSSVNYANLD